MLPKPDHVGQRKEGGGTGGGGGGWQQVWKGM